jgi:hypothetical protein
MKISYKESQEKNEKCFPHLRSNEPFGPGAECRQLFPRYRQTVGHCRGQCCATQEKFNVIKDDI